MTQRTSSMAALLTMQEQPIVTVVYSGNKGGLYTLIDDKWEPLAISGVNHAGMLFLDRAGTLWIGTFETEFFASAETEITFLTRAKNNEQKIGQATRMERRP